MFVKSIMIPRYKCVTAQQDEALHSVLEKLDGNEIDGVPVLDGDKYVGVVTRHGIYQQYFETGNNKDEFLQNTTAKDILTLQEQILHGSEIFESTFVKLKDIPLMAVIDEYDRFQGIVTRSDALDQFQSAFGVHREGVRIAFTSVETEGRIARLADIAHQFHEHIISLVTFDETDKLVRRIVMKIEKKDNIDRFIKKLEDSGFRILDIHEV
ncbi:CBS domain-containing protein [Mesobacillus subterraneus]|uniref:CBS domain-containing protein n=1 Tax=Mesobacillus subterraneus TaxID=285983 RepID=A0A427TPZ8_9BACI|nr:CBS domain-containing protein [Mesobacillus subterraneus]RSD26469.1 CBS domain-containing protein [Mesobacillus subterraneus]